MCAPFGSWLGDWICAFIMQIAAVEGSAGREYTEPQLLISLWLYAYSRGINSARELARQCEYEPGCQWLCGLQPVSHRTLSGFRSDKQAALNDLFTQVLGILSAEGLITLDGTKIRNRASRLSAAPVAAYRVTELESNCRSLERAPSETKTTNRFLILALMGRGRGTRVPALNRCVVTSLLHYFFASSRNRAQERIMARGGHEK